MEVKRGRFVDDGLAFCRVAGVSHYQEALSRCSAGERVLFVHEPDNPHDEMALRVISAAQETIGYVPRANWLHRLIHEQGRGIAATIASVGYGRACLLGATLAVVVTDDHVGVASYYPDRHAPEPPAGGFRYWVKSPSDVARLLEGRKGSASPTQPRRPKYPRHSGIEG
ncbi:HIRAN domain-containing protein [Sphingomonas oryzagri]|uniref:HIRAN domain-containing protein n=1 Tax=Sphingomonas oryzagri TaxID=3042314 RepID=UPI0036F4222B